MRQCGLDLALVVLGLDTESSAQGGEALGDRTVSTSPVDQDTDPDAQEDEDHTDCVQQGGRPRRDHVVADGDEHGSILAEVQRGVVTATVASPNRK